MTVLRPILAVVFLFGGTAAASVALMIGFTLATSPEGHAFQAIPAVLFIGICTVAAAVAAKLWPRWREGLAACLVIHAATNFSVSRTELPPGVTPAPPGQYTVPAALLLAAAIVVFVWDRLRRRSASG